MMMHRVSLKQAKQPRWVYAIAAVAVCALIGSLISGSNLLFALAMLANLALIWRLVFCSPEINSANPFAHIKVEKQELIIGEARFPVHEVRKVAIERSDGKGLLQLPYNGGGQLQLVFDGSYLDDLKAYIQQNMPHVEIVT
ncbi:hypothetical protein [Pseudoalteromonas sp. BDTF-M6]|uniref:hypothetical protein n=1 Tax=Pseudoalteromonas sp. BDTF-M6 TaxID=2796132 RepID=UPI001BAFC56C|nr:hypothetical protein [Pseudoalteromonas sp. BDTF-M6]MBS3797548.1 hypothetical protein [Pseudoalteromonas sp. BDTF-M6]